jgi:hypothetical protein
MKAYAIGQTARMAGFSLWTLHHYDHIGLLTPSARTAAGYRLSVTHPEFRAFYDNYRPDLADFVAEAMAHYADTVLSERSE